MNNKDKKNELELEMSETKNEDTHGCNCEPKCEVCTCKENGIEIIK